MDDVDFQALINNKIHLVPASPEDLIATFFNKLKKDEVIQKYIPAHLTYEDCTFYGLRDAVSVGIEDVSDHEEATRTIEEAMQACLNEDNRLLLFPSMARIGKLAELFYPDHVYLVIDFPDSHAESEKAIRNLEHQHRELFKCLQITVEGLDHWKPDDVARNLRGGTFDDKCPSEFEAIEATLEMRRTFKLNNVDVEDLACALHHKTEFHRNFELVCNSNNNTVKTGRELVAFLNVIRWFNSDVSKITESNSVYLKNSNFIVRFIQPPFLLELPGSSPFSFETERSWSFPFFVDTTSARSVWKKITPTNGWMVVSRDHKIPLIISELISQKGEQDRNRMLVQAIVLARAGQHLMKSTSKARFFVVVIHVDAHMDVSRYIVMQTGGRNNPDAVSIHRKGFQLSYAKSQLDFLRDMYNLETQITQLVGELDEAKKGSLGDVNDAARDVLSFAGTENLWTRTTSSTTLNSTLEESEEEDEPEDLGVFAAEDVRNVLHRMDYKIHCISSEHPELAFIVNEVGDKRGYLKFVRRQQEVEVLQHLTQIKSPSNHTVSDAKFWPVQGGTVISMPIAGCWLTSLKQPETQLWSVARQLFEAVAFMHEHNVAHMNIKPQNVVIPQEGGRLSIVGFGVSVRVRDRNTRYNGVVGTKNYIAPEVRKGGYKPLAADLWSCGKTLKVLCEICSHSPDRAKLLVRASQLMVEDPEERPKMATMLKWMDSPQK